MVTGNRPGEHTSKVTAPSGITGKQVYHAHALMCHLQAVHGDPRISIMLGVAIVMGYVYQGPPFRLACLPMRLLTAFHSGYHSTSMCVAFCCMLVEITVEDNVSSGMLAESNCICRWSYKGLGEPLCFVAFGPLATCAFYLAQVCYFAAHLSSQSGMAFQAMLACSAALLVLQTT